MTPSVDTGRTDAESVVPEGAADPAPGPPPGTVLGSYRLVELLGAGGMGLVYLAEHVRLGRRVALKLLRAELGGDALAVSRFFAEARAVNQIHHDNIVEITDFIENPSGDNYYIMEFLPGLNLEQLVQRDASDGTLPIARTLGIAVQVCSALASVHDAGIVHRDLKPENIFLTERGGQKDFVKLLDFGIAKLGKAEGTIATNKTGAGIIVGTPEYMSPEQASGVAVDGRSDMYALGTILYELIAGQRPFDGENFGEILVARLSRTPTPPSQHAQEHVPPELDALVLECIAAQRDARPQNIREVEARLRAIADAQACTLENFEPPRSTGAARASAGRSSRAMALAAAATAILGVGALFASRLLHHAAPSAAIAARPAIAPAVASPVPAPEAAPTPPPAATAKPVEHDQPAEEVAAAEATPARPSSNHRAHAKRHTQKFDGPSRHAVIDPFK